MNFPLLKGRTPLLLFFWLCCSLVFILSNSSRIVNFGPRSIHIWRQADCASYALNYYQNQKPFFEPQTHTLTGKDGHTVSEFPVIYYIAGGLYSFFGPQEIIIRLLTFSIFLFGCSCLLLTGFEFYSNKWLALFPALVTFTSPYLYYYGLNFLPDVPALSLALAGTYFFVLYLRKQTFGWAFIAAFCFCIACLLKISAGIAPVAIAGALVTQFLFSKKTALPKGDWWKLTLLFVFIIAPNLAWVMFAKHYNMTNGTGQNLLGLYPLWDADKNEIIYILKRIYTEWSRVILHPVLWVALLPLIGITVWRRNQVPSLYLLTLAFVCIGALTYSVLWYRAYLDHDYYMINPFIAVVWILLIGCLVIDRHIAARKLWAAPIAAALLLLGIVHCANVQKYRYSAPVYQYVKESYYDIEPYLRKIGVSRLDKVMSVPDVSPNITLYYLNQPGWTEAFNGDQYNINFFASQGAKYLIVGDTAYLQNPLYANHAGEKIGEHKGIFIYRME